MRTRIWIPILAAVGVLMLTLVALTAASLVRAPSEPAANERDLPPSERRSGNGQSDTGESPAEPPGSDDEASGHGDYARLVCEFSGRALLSPGLPMNYFGGGSAQKMELAPGASFACTDSDGDTSGKVELTAVFPDLALFSGVGIGKGRITWSDPSTLEPATPLSESTTEVEIELDYPEIFVWTSITSGPHAGKRGKLRLVGWERVMDEQNRIVEIVFQPTEVAFAPY